MRKVIQATYIIFFIAIINIYFGCEKQEESGFIKPIKSSGEVNPAFSPNGDYIAYATEAGDEILLLEIASEESEYLTDGRLPDWSPDGGEIAYVKGRDIYKINVATKHIQQLTTWGSCFFPDWAINGRQLAFDCTIGNADSNGIWILNIVDSTTKHVGLGREPDWNPNCDRIAYTGRSSNPSHHEHDVWITDTSGTDTIRLTDNGAQSPSFSPNGSLIAYVGVIRDTIDPYEVLGINVWVMDTVGMHKTQLTFDGGWEPAWSPDGNQIVYVRGESVEKRNVIEVTYHLWIMDVSGENKRQLTGNVIETFGCK